MLRTMCGVLHPLHIIIYFHFIFCIFRGNRWHSTGTLVERQTRNRNITLKASIYNWPVPSLHGATVTEVITVPVDQLVQLNNHRI